MNSLNTSGDGTAALRALYRRSVAELASTTDEAHAVVLRLRMYELEQAIARKLMDVDQSGTVVTSSADGLDHGTPFQAPNIAPPQPGEAIEQAPKP